MRVRRFAITAAAAAIASTLALASGAAGSAPLALKVNAASGRHAISPLIYGVNYSNGVAGLSKVFAVPVDRWGGNSTSTYNYQNATYNTGADWYFENIVAQGQGTLNAQIASDRAAKSVSLVTVPMIGWVSKDSSRGHPFTCSFPKTAFATQSGFDPYDGNCGTGKGADGQTWLAADPNTSYVPADANFDASMVASLVKSYGAASKGGVKIYELDNEPVLWNSTHVDAHATPLSYDELKSKSIATATAVKRADPSASVLGPSDWGWCAYFYSAVDNCGGNPTDFNAHNQTPLGAWYLQQFAAASKTTGKRLLDYFDEHFYPQEVNAAVKPSQSVSLATAGNAATQALRLRSTRALWDPTYVDESWISGANNNKPLQWIRVMKSWVNKYYPGTKTAITEYNWGGLESINGALAQADVLGIFGREGLDLATLWGATNSSDPWAFAFKIYRNYDGKNSKFGDVSVTATSTDQGRLSVYAATRTTDGALTVVVINKSGATLTAPLSLTSLGRRTVVRSYRYSSARLGGVVALPRASVRASKLTAAYPANSITLLVFTKK